MADEEELSVDATVKRSVGRAIRNALLFLLLVAALGGWAYFGFYQLEPGQSAIVFRLGKFLRIEANAGLRYHLPPPFESHEVVNVAELSREDFGVRLDGDPESMHEAELEATMQTSDNSIVNLGFVVQYRIGDAFESRYGVADVPATLRDAAQAAVREVVGKMNIDAVLTEQRGIVQSEGERVLQEIVDSYAMGITIEEIQLQEVQPPEQVRGAFDDVIAAAQDASLIVNRAEGYQNELLPSARAEANELLQSAYAYRDSKIAEAKGEAQRFTALLAAYQAAPEVTKKRLYLETMEEVLPKVEMVIIEPGTTSVLPYLPLGAARSGAGAVQP